MKTLPDPGLPPDGLALQVTLDIERQQVQKIHNFIATTKQPVTPDAPETVLMPMAATSETAQPFRSWLQHPPIQPWQTGFNPEIPAQVTRIKKPPLWRKQSFGLYAMAAVIFAVGATVSLNGLRANRQVSAQVQRLTVQGAKTDSDSNNSAPAVQKPSAVDINSYAVAPNLPRFVDITKLGVHARILSMGVTSKNQLEAPGNVYDAGWYNASAQPGQAGGMLLDGHISSWTTKGVFYGLSKLVNGDQITITRGDGQKFIYTVIKKQLFDADKVDMQSMLVSQDPTKPGLNLISCSGEVIPGTNEFNKRLVIYAAIQ